MHDSSGGGVLHDDYGTSGDGAGGDGAGGDDVHGGDDDRGGDDVRGGDVAGRDGKASPVGAQVGAQVASEELEAKTNVLLVQSRRWLSTSDRASDDGLDAGTAFAAAIGLDAGTASAAVIGLDAGTASAAAIGLDSGTASAAAGILALTRGGDVDDLPNCMQALTRGGDVEGQARAAHVVATLALDGEESLRDRGGLICMLSASLSAC